MPRLVTEYTLLVSCPSDIVEEKDIIKRVLQDFNRSHSLKYHITIRFVDWQFDTYSSVGKNPQDLINSQIVDQADMAIALFWNKSGTPTKKAASGTIEEIDRLCAQKKQVFLYFSERPASNIKIVAAQFAKVKQIKNRYKDTSLYRTYDDLAKFEAQFSNDLNNYVVSHLSSNKPTIQQRFSDITVQRNTLQARIQEAKHSVFISGASLISSLTTSFSYCTNNNISVRLLMTKEDHNLIGECAKLSYTTTSELLSHIRTTKRHFKNNPVSLPIEIKCINAVMPVALVGIDIDQPYGKIYIQQYLYKQNPAQDPCYICVSGEKWYDVYCKQIKQLWNDSEIIDFSTV